MPDIDLFSPEVLLAPYDAYRTLRDEAPVYFVEAMNVHVVTRYDLVREAIRDTATFSSRFDGFLQESQRMLFASASPAAQARITELAGKMIELPPTMLTLDEPRHTQYRSLVSKLFTAGRIRKAEDAVQQVIDETIASFSGKTRIDFMQAFATPVPLTIIADRLGIPDADRAFFDEGATAAASALRISPLTSEQLIHRAEVALALQDLLVDIVEQRRADPTDDMISVLANSRLEPDGRPLTHGEALSILNQFLVAGHETTSSAFGWGMLQLCVQPGLQDEVRGQPDRIKTFVEEALRIEAPVQGLPRLVTKDAELGGVALPAGSMIMLRFGAANRDERQFAEPDRIDIAREKAGMQLAFGSGVHACIGAPLARQELQLGFLALLDHMHAIEVDPEAAPPQPEASFVLRNLATLPVRFAPRDGAPA